MYGIISSVLAWKEEDYVYSSLYFVLLGGLQACNRITGHETYTSGGCTEPISLSTDLAPAKAAFQEMFRLQNIQGRKGDSG